MKTRTALAVAAAVGVAKVFLIGEHVEPRPANPYAARCRRLRLEDEARRGAR